MRTGDIILGQYQVCRQLGKGGMGEVYLAKDMQDGMLWAIKLQAYNENNYELLSSEVEVQSKLNHPAVPKIRQTYTMDRYLYIVMEFVEGRTLDDYLKTGEIIPENIALKWFQQICDVLVYLHGQDVPIVYRDLKPSNIMIQPSGDVKIIDFGIAGEYQQGEKPRRKQMALTRGYAAPEQYNSRYMMDVRTDIYALGVTMHYMLTGKNPNTPPYYFRPVRKLNRDISYGLEYIVKKCIQPNPDKRYGSATELRDELDGIGRLEKKLKKKRTAQKRRIMAGASAVLLLSVCLFLFVKSKRSATINAYYSYLGQAEDYRNAGAYEEALQIYEKAAKMQPEAREAYLGTANIYLENGSYEDCYRILKDMADRFPDIFEDEEFIRITRELYRFYDEK